MGDAADRDRERKSFQVIKLLVNLVGLTSPALCPDLQHLPNPCLAVRIAAAAGWKTRETPQADQCLYPAEGSTVQGKFVLKRGLLRGGAVWCKGT